MEQLYSRNEVERMLGVSRRQLDYWARLRLVLPRSRWGERFFSFSDLVALETIKCLAARKVPAKRIRRAVTALESALGGTSSPLSRLRISTNGKQIVVHSSGETDRPFEPLTGQFVLNFETADIERKVRTIASRSAEEWFEMGMALDSKDGSLEQAADAYRRAAEAAPDWVEAHINLGTTLFQLDRISEAQEEFEAAVAFDPNNALAQFNLGCVLDRIGQIDAAIERFECAIGISPSLADAHLNLALAYEKRGQGRESVRELSQYLRYEPQGPWSGFARSRLARKRSSQGHSSASRKLTPFRRRR